MEILNPGSMLDSTSGIMNHGDAERRTPALRKISSINPSAVQKIVVVERGKENLPTVMEPFSMTRQPEIANATKRPEEVCAVVNAKSEMTIKHDNGGEQTPHGDLS